MIKRNSRCLIDVNADKAALLRDSALSAYMPITVGNDVALSTSECVYYATKVNSYSLIKRSGVLLLLFVRIPNARIVLSGKPCFCHMKHSHFRNYADPLRSTYLLPQSHQYSLRLTNGRNHHESIINSIKTSTTMHWKSSSQNKIIQLLAENPPGATIKRPPLEL